MNICYFLSLLASRLVQVQISDGILQGEIVNNEYNDNCPYYRFRGIPYAEPPVGDLRFKAPQPNRPWEGVRDATKHGPQCYQTYQTSSGSEDCLYLNVYTPNIAPIEPLPVMVYIHGGGFTGGSGNDENRGPQYLLRKNIVLVTLNYRLEVLGFLSLDTEDIPGNAGMKDQVAALRWVKKNIKNFGGDPDNITIFGESAGSASVSFHLVSPMSKGLFNRAITQSGSLAMWWPNTYRARDRALLLARDLGCNSTDDKEIYEFFKTQPLQNLVNKTVPISFWHSVKRSPVVYFGIVSETQFGNNERFFYGESFDLLRNGVHEGIQVMAGYTADDGIMYFIEDMQGNTILNQANHYLEFFVPEPYANNIPLTAQMEVGRRFKDFYLKNNTASKATVDYILQYHTMELFAYGTISQQKMIARTNRNKVYLYEFTCYSDLNYLAVVGAPDLFDHRPMVGHADDLPYLFSIFPVDMNSREFKMIDQMTSLWTNFAKYGDPTPDDSLGVKWLPYTIEDQDYLDIGEHLVPGKRVEGEDVEFWESNFREFLPQFAP